MPLGKRVIDLAVVLAAAPFVLPLALVVAILVKATSKGPAIYWSDRVGAGERTFRMPKFRTMRIGTPAVATHLLDDPAAVLTPVGGFLRASSLDEVPQLWCVLLGQMTLVGPRPALYNQDDLIAFRRKKGVHVLTPGLTGLAQISGRDDLPIPQKVAFDERYLASRSLWLDLKIMLVTVVRILRKEGVHH